MESSHHLAAELDKIFSWLSARNFWSRQNDILRTRVEGTGNWFLATPEFTDWLAGTSRILFCQGIPGAGKTVLASIVVNHLQASFKQADIGIAGIFCNYNESSTQNISDLFGSLLQQL